MREKSRFNSKIDRDERTRGSKFFFFYKLEFERAIEEEDRYSSHSWTLIIRGKTVCLAIRRFRKEGWKRGRLSCAGGEEHQLCDAFHDHGRFVHGRTRAYSTRQPGPVSTLQIIIIIVTNGTFIIYICSTRKSRNEFRKMVFKIFFFYHFFFLDIET